MLYRLLFFGQHRFLGLFVLLVACSSRVVFVLALQIVVQTQKRTRRALQFVALLELHVFSALISQLLLLLMGSELGT